MFKLAAVLHIQGQGLLRVIKYLFPTYQNKTLQSTKLTQLRCFSQINVNNYQVGQKTSSTLVPKDPETMWELLGHNRTVSNPVLSPTIPEQLD